MAGESLGDKGPIESGQDEWPKEICEAIGEQLVKSVFVKNENEIHVALKTPQSIPTACDALYRKLGYRFAMVMCSDERAIRDHFVLRYVFELGLNGYAKDAFVFATAEMNPPQSSAFPSIALQIPSAALYEREIMDMFGLVPVGNPDTRPLVLHEHWPRGVYPLRKEFDILTKTTMDRSTNYDFAKVDGEGVCEIPVGPVHAGIIEPGHFRFSILGENILNLETRLFYTHKGVEKLAETMTLEDAVLLSERIAGDESVANSTAYCQAVEKIADFKPTRRAARIRAMCAEMERIYNHIGTLAGISTDVGFAYGASRLNILKERMMQLNEKISGSRLLFGVNRIGGVGINPREEETKELQATCTSVQKDFDKVILMLKNKSSFVDRLLRTGAVSREVATDLQIVGVAARCAGVDIDTRIDHPYAAYDEITNKRRGSARERVAREIELQKRQGDVMARFNLRVEEVTDSLSIVQELSSNLGDDVTDFASPNLKQGLEPFGSALGYSESHRGQTLVWVMLGMDGKTISRFKVRTASFCNWPAIEHAVLNDIVPDFPLVNKSFDLSYSGNDL
ncbi:MAG: NADH-quinone oxidoreductase subunit C [Nitrososphaerota archaeon]|nr:NADH-quinone oxidoreductase subunit C [Nitrososphaerota archaeon]